MDVKTKPARFSPEYLALLGSFPLRPIHDDAEHRRAIEVVNSLIDRPALSRDEEDYLDVLGLIIADYEDSIYEHPEFSSADRLRHLMDEHGLSQAELARRAGVDVKSVSDVLAGKRQNEPQSPSKSSRALWCLGCLLLLKSGFAGKSEVCLDGAWRSLERIDPGQ